MKAHELFGVVVRVIGLSLLLSALWMLVAGIANPHNFLGWVFATIPVLAIGFVFFRRADQIVQFAYPEEFPRI